MQNVFRPVANQVLDRLSDCVRMCTGQIDLVQDDNDLEVVLDRQIEVRDGLRLDSLARVDHENGALARVQSSRHLVGEIDVSRCVDQVQRVILAIGSPVIHADGVTLDRDAALAFKVHAVQHLLVELALGQRTGSLQ